jgi:hypothetical protein
VSEADDAGASASGNLASDTSELSDSVTGEESSLVSSEEAESGATSRSEWEAIDRGEVVLKLIRPGQHNVATDRQILAVNVVRSPRVPRILEEGSVQTPFGDLVWLREQPVIGRTVREHLQSGPFANHTDPAVGLARFRALVSC